MHNRLFHPWWPQWGQLRGEASLHRRDLQEARLAEAKGEFHVDTLGSSPQAMPGTPGWILKEGPCNRSWTPGPSRPGGSGTRQLGPRSEGDAPTA